MHFFPRVASVLGLCAIAAACDSSKGATPTGATLPSTGSLSVTVNVADGMTPSVIVTGPNAYTKTIASTQTLTGLTPGTYTIVADSAAVPDSVIGTIVDTGNVTGSPARVTAGDTTSVTVAYGMKYRVGGLWIANNGDPALIEISANQLSTSGSATPAETLATRVSQPSGLALDVSGNMWESSVSGDTLLMYSAAARNTTGSAPSTVLISTALDTAENLAFDAHDNLWVTTCNAAAAVLEFSAAQLAAGGIQTPTVTIKTGNHAPCPWALTFDLNGNLWVTDTYWGHVVGYSAAQLAVAGSSSPAPFDTVGRNGNSFIYPTGIAFDGSGNMWVANGIEATLVEFTPSQVAADGSPIPTVTIALPDPLAFGLAIDKRGTLWVTDHDQGSVYGFTSAQLTASGAPTPAISLSITVPGALDFEQPLFDPYATATGVAAATVRPHPMATRSVPSSLTADTRINGVNHNTGRTAR